MRAKQEGDISLKSHLGIKEYPIGFGYVFNNIFKISIELDLQWAKNDPLEELDCSKYKVYGLSRIKRDVEIQSTFSNCAYSFTPGDENIIKSESEEIYWQNFMASEKPSVIFCDTGYGDNCLLRALHTPDASVFWHKKYNSTSRKNFIQRSYILHNPPKNISISKEILYRSQRLVQQAKNNEPISLAYECLGDPYLNKSQFVEIDPYLKNLRENKEKILYMNLGRIVSTVDKTVDQLSSKNIVTFRELIKLKNIAVSKLPVYNDLNKKITFKLEELGPLRWQVTTLLILNAKQTP